MYCTNCGRSEDGTLFCTQCGCRTDAQDDSANENNYHHCLFAQRAASVSTTQVACPAPVQPPPAGLPKRLRP